LVNLGGFMLGPVIFDHSVGLQDVRPDLIAPGGFMIFTAQLGFFISPFFACPGGATWP